MKPVILLIDDEEDLVGVLRDAIALSLPEYRAVGTTSVEHAQETLETLDRTEPLSLVCADHRLGGRTGLDFLEEIRARYPHVPTVLFTGQAELSVEERAEAAGTKVLWKPIRLKQWIGEVRGMLSGSA